MPIIYIWPITCSSYVMYSFVKLWLDEILESANLQNHVYNYFLNQISRAIPYSLLPLNGKIFKFNKLGNTTWLAAM